MTTRRQIEASRRDAQARTGPTTEAGKAASSDGSQEELRNEPNSAQPLDPAPSSGTRPAPVPGSGQPRRRRLPLRLARWPAESGENCETNPIRRNPLIPRPVPAPRD